LWYGVISMAKGVAKEAKRDQTTVNLTPDAHKLLNEYAERRGGRGLKKTIISRLLAWFVSQPDPVKSSIMGWVDGGMSDTYAQVLEKMAAELRSGRKPVFQNLVGSDIEDVNSPSKQRESDESADPPSRDRRQPAQRASGRK
jgi:hypothetical protein